MVNFVSTDNNDEFKNKNLFIVARMYGFTWILFHFTIIYFFWLILDSILLVGLFLWFWNLIAFLLDIPIWIIQKYYRPKNLLIFAWVLMLFVSLIFFKFIYFSWLWTLNPSFIETALDSEIMSNMVVFMDNSFNLFLVLLTAVLYWLIKETFDITFLSYVLGNSSISKYAENLSKYNISFWTWALIWMVISWIILWLTIKWAIFAVFIFILIFLFIIFKFFDKSESILDFSKLNDLNITSVNGWIDDSKKYILSNIKRIEVKDIINTNKAIFLAPLKIKNDINISEIKELTIASFISVLNVLLETPRNIVILWSMVVLLFFSFWDTFVITFQIDFLNKIVILNSWSFIISETWGFITGYVLLWLLITPIFFAQQFFIDQSKFRWVFSVMSFWILLSAISIFLFWFSQNIIFLIFFWLLNSFWYAAVMPLAMATFSEKYNIEYAKKYKLKEIDFNSSAAPLKIIMNIANVLWLVVWGFIVAVLWFNWFFIFFWLCLFIFFIISMLNKEKILEKQG